MSTKDYVRDLRALIGTRPVNLVGSAGLVLNPAGELLLQRKCGTDRWTVPGGICELGEGFEDTLRRELREEAALTVERAELLAVVSGAPTFKRIGNGDEFFMYTAVYLVRGWSGTPTPDGEESEELGFFPLDALPRWPGRWAGARRTCCGTWEAEPHPLRARSSSSEGTHRSFWARTSGLTLP